MSVLDRLTPRGNRPREEDQPLVVSLCGTYLKPEMQSLYRQISRLKRWRTVVMTETVQNAELFPFPDIRVMQRKWVREGRGNFVLRFWYKHVTKQWPPPRPLEQATRKLTYDLVSMLRAARPDLVHVYYGHKGVKYLPLLRAWGGPFIVSFHGVDVIKFMDQPGYPEQMRELLEAATLVLARSESLLATVRSLGCPPEKLRLNRTAVPLDRIPFGLKEAPADGKWRLLQACRWIEKKGLFTVLNALPQVVARFPQVKFILCGSGPDEERLRARVKELGLHEHVEFKGWLNQADLTELYGSSHIFLHPSETTPSGDQEGVPNSMLEAMAAGMPVVATRHGGIPEAVTHGRHGFLVPERNADALAEALLSLMTSPETLSRLSAAAAASAREHFGLDRCVAALEDCYSEAVERGPTPGSAGRWSWGRRS